MQRNTVLEIVRFRFPLLLSSNGRSGIKREHSEGSYHDNDDDDVEEEEDDGEKKRVTMFCIQVFSLQSLTFVLYLISTLLYTISLSSGF